MQNDLSCCCYGLTPAEIALMWQTAPPRKPIPQSFPSSGMLERSQPQIRRLALGKAMGEPSSSHCLRSRKYCCAPAMFRFRERIIKNSRVEPYIAGRVAGDSGVHRRRQRERLRKANLDLELPRGGPPYKHLVFRRSPRGNRCAKHRKERLGKVS
jgi:hypothetical protein